MKLQLVSIEKDGLVKVASVGNITAADVDATGTNALQHAIGQNWRDSRVLLDLAGTQYVDSSAVGWLIGTSKQIKDHGGSFVVYNVQPAVRQILDLLRVGRVVAIVEDEHAAKEVATAAA